jgi:hypothetical protein
LDQIKVEERPMLLELRYKIFLYNFVMNVANRLQSKAASMWFNVLEIEEKLAQDAKGNSEIDVVEVQWLKEK